MLDALCGAPARARRGPHRHRVPSRQRAARGASTSGSAFVRSTRSGSRCCCERRCARMTMRIGNGFDVHALVAGRPLVLGGVTIPFDRGLDGPLGRRRAAARDRATRCSARSRSATSAHFFPDTDPRWKGADSRELLRHVMTHVASQRLVDRQRRHDGHRAGAAARAARAGDAREHRARPRLRRRPRVGEGDDDRAARVHRARRGHRRRSGRAARCAQTRATGARASGRGDARRLHARHAGSGSVTRAIVPPPSRGSRSNVPPCSRAMRSTIARPSPAPAAPSSRVRDADRARERLLQPLDVAGRDARARDRRRRARRRAPSPARADLDRRRAVGERVVDEVAAQPRHRRRPQRQRPAVAGDEAHVLADAARSGRPTRATTSLRSRTRELAASRRRARSRGTGR